jgi:hypothetical protein
MGITKFEEFIIWAKTHSPDEFARLPDPTIYNITRRRTDHISVIVGTITCSVVHLRLISGDHSLKVYTHLDANSGP